MNVLNLRFAAAASLVLSLFFLVSLSFAQNQTSKLTPTDAKFDLNEDGVMDGLDWRKMSEQDKKTYARLSLEAIGENPSAIVRKGVTRESLFIQGLEAVYRR
ncbi:MAG: hypothetical protein AUK35_06105 [Zetaproteobacteria bacterium CG2_30_46_52]|nr:MAG: hypothetical protein AUK35_06105 [Zetaproteobacteria bacterium CG2_30_46_52]